MLNLIKNELLKIFKRKKIYILFIIGFLLITSYNLFQKLTTSNVDIHIQYQKAYTNDKLFLENYNELQISEDYSDIVERLALEKYAIENNIQYNILLNSQNNNTPIPTDARILLMQLFDKFDIVLIFIILYLSCTIISEEFHNGTIKNLLTKPHSRTKILLSKILSSLLIILSVILILVIFQYVLGGLLFGFDSYSLEAIRYNHFTESIETMNLAQYIIIIILSKLPMYLLLNLLSLLLGVITNTIALNILITLGLYVLSTMKNLINTVTQFLFIYNWDISNYLFTTDLLLKKSIAISSISILLAFSLFIIIFRNRDIKNI